MSRLPPAVRRLRRPGPLALVVLVGLVVLAGVWVTLTALAARTHLDRARVAANALERAVRSDDQGAAHRSLATVQDESARAKDLTHDPVWWTVSKIPVLGDTPDAVRTVAATIDELARDAFPRLVRVAGALDPDTLRPSGDRIAVASLVAARPDVVAAAAGVHAARTRVDGIGGLLLGPVPGAVADSRAQLRRLDALTSTASRAVDLLPPMLGGDGPRSYLVAVQNPAEARGTGGLLGAYAVVDVQDGRVRLRAAAPNTLLRGAPRVPVDLGRDFARLYGDDPALWANANLSPHFPYAARIWLALWERQFGERLDGVVATDPVALGFLVGATRPVRLADGTTLTADTTADFVMRRVYAIERANRVRDALTTDLGRRIITNVLHGDADPGRLLTAVRHAATAGRLLVYSAHPAEQRLLTGTDVGGDGPTAAGAVSVVVNNGAGNKLDAYLARTVDYRPCAGGHDTARLTVRLTNRAPGTGLPGSAIGRRVRDAQGALLPPGTNRSLLYVFGPSGARLAAAELDGRKATVRFGRERGHPVYATAIDLAPGRTRTLVLRLTGVADTAQPHFDVQPAALPQRSVIERSSC